MRRRYRIVVAGRSHTVEVNGDGGDAVTARVLGEADRATDPVPVSEPVQVKVGRDPGAFTGRLHWFDGVRVVNAWVSAHAAANAIRRARVFVGGVECEVTIEDARAAALIVRAVRTPTEGPGPAVVAAPMPGKIVKVCVAVGDPVSRGQSMFVVEAMKMENEIGAPRAGRVMVLGVREGQLVEAGTVLATIA